MGTKHPGFKKVARGIAAKEGISEQRADAILASSSRKASPAAKKKNPKLLKVKGTPAKMMMPKSMRPKGM